MVTQLYGPAVDVVGKSATFWFFATVLVFIFIFCVAFVPETKGRTLDEIQRMFRVRKKRGKLNLTFLSRYTNQVSGLIPWAICSLLSEVFLNGI